MKIPHLDYIRTLSTPEFPDLGARLYEALHAIQGQASTTESQANLNPTGNPAAPPPLDGIKVSGQNGHFQIAIQHSAPIYRGVRYFVEHADNPHFTNPHVIALGESRNHSVFLGNVTRYFRAYTSYASSPPSEPTYHGSSAAPTPVLGGGSVGGPAFQPSQGSGTGAAGVGLSGPGPIPFRSVSGAPPTR